MIPIWYLSGRLGNQMFQLAYLYAQQQRGAIPDIWLQYPEHFAGAEDFIKQTFGEGIRQMRDEYVSIHVRRGDYVKHSQFVQLWDTDYYVRAMEQFPGARFLIFSDDKPWCREHFQGPHFEFAWGRDEIEDLNLMASCRHNIIANSSFSWWAAYLNQNPNKQVIYPKAWHSDGVQRVGFPPEWTGL